MTDFDFAIADAILAVRKEIERKQELLKHLQREYAEIDDYEPTNKDNAGQA
jgi:hypothetical protein